MGLNLIPLGIITLQTGARDRPRTLSIWRRDAVSNCTPCGANRLPSGARGRPGYPSIVVRGGGLEPPELLGLNEATLPFAHPRIWCLTGDSNPENRPSHGRMYAIPSVRHFVAPRLRSDWSPVRGLNPYLPAENRLPRPLGERAFWRGLPVSNRAQPASKASAPTGGAPIGKGAQNRTAGRPGSEPSGGTIPYTPIEFIHFSHHIHV